MKLSTHFSNISSAFSRYPLWFTGLIAVLALLPLPFGANRPWASDLFGVVSALLLLGMAFDVYRTPSLWPAGGPARRLGLSAALIAMVALWAFFQTQSWLPSVWHHPLWKEVRDMPGALAGFISIDPDQFPESLTRLLAYAACFLLAFAAGRDSQRARALLLALSVIAVVYAFYGLFMQSTGLHMILWFDKWAYVDQVTSTFVNKNSYATYAGLGLLSCLALFWQHLKHKPEARPDQHSFKVAWLEKLLRRDSRYLIMGLIVLGALLLSGSRAGMASTLAACAVFLAALAINRRWRWGRWLTVLLAGIIVVFGYSLVSNGLFFDLLNQNQLQADAPMRLGGYAIIMRAIGTNPWLGFGLGSFESVFRIYRDPGFDMWFQHAHNDYLEIALELGIPAALMYVTAILLMVSCCVRGVWQRKRQEIFPALGLSASALVGLHSLADFSLQIPAVAATYAVLLGLGVAQSWSSRAQREDDEKSLFSGRFDGRASR